MFSADADCVLGISLVTNLKQADQKKKLINNYQEM